MTIAPMMQMRAGSANQTTISSRPVWRAQDAGRAGRAALRGTVRADTLVIGGGVAGLSTALHLAEAGRDVVLLEAECVGAGATGQSGGLIAPSFIGLTPASAVQVLGRERGERLIRFVGASARNCFDTLERHGVACDANRDGFWSPAHTAKLADQQRTQAEDWRAFGFDVSFEHSEATRLALGSPRYCGSLRFADGGSLEPLALAQGLSTAAAGRGAEIFEYSKVVSLDRTDGAWRADTAGGTVLADRVVLAANGANGVLHRAMRHTVAPLHVIEFATAPLSAQERQAVLPSGEAFTDRQAYVFTARYDAHGRLISAFPRTLAVRGGAGLEAEAIRRLRRNFPGLREPRIEHLWNGTAWLSPTLRPQLHTLGEGAYAIQACNGRGLPTNVMLGAELANVLATGRSDAMSVPFEPPRPMHLHFLARHAPLALMTLAYARSRWRIGSRTSRSTA